MSAELYGYGILAAVVAVLGAFLVSVLSGWRHEKHGEQVGSANQAAKDRAQGIVDAAKQGPDALEAEGRKVFADLDKELGKEP